MRVLILIILVLFLNQASGEEYENFPLLKGPYLGQTAPGDIPAVFGDGFLKPQNGYHSSIIFSPTMDEAFWTAMGKETYFSKIENDSWSPPIALDFDTLYGVGEPMFSPDGKRLYYLSFRPPNDSGVVRERIWYVERKDSTFGQPRLIDEIVYNHPTHWQFSFANNGNLYFTSEISGVKGAQDIYCSRWNGNEYSEPFSLGDSVNSDVRDFCPYISPDESYLIFSRSVPEESNRSDLFISFRNSKDGWSEAVNMGDTVNSLHNETSAVVTPDGKYLFFLRVSGDENNVYWMSSDIIYDLK